MAASVTAAAGGANAGGANAKALRCASALLNRRLRVFLTDGRVLLGSLKCIDRQGNLLLGNTMEVRRRERGDAEAARARGDARNAAWEERKVGLVVVPPQHRSRCEAKMTEEEAAALLVDAP